MEDPTGALRVGVACKPGTLQVGLGASGYVNQAVIKREGSCKQRGSDLEKGVFVDRVGSPGECLGFKEGCEAGGAPSRFQINSEFQPRT